MVTEGASGKDNLLAASLVDLRASVGLGREGGLGRDGASGTDFTALAAAAAAAAAHSTQTDYALTAE